MLVYISFDSLALRKYVSPVCISISQTLPLYSKETVGHCFQTLDFAFKIKYLFNVLKESRKILVHGGQKCQDFEGLHLSAPRTCLRSPLTSLPITFILIGFVLRGPTFTSDEDASGLYFWNFLVQFIEVPFPKPMGFHMYWSQNGKPLRKSPG